MRLHIRAGLLPILAVLTAFGTGNAGAYSLVAQAGADGESTSTFSVDSVSAAYIGIAEDGDYGASANATTGHLSAAASVGLNAFTGYQKRSAARIEERITFKGNPTGPVTVTLSLDYGGGASATTGSAVASGQVGTSGCNVYVEDHSSTGGSFIDNCITSPVGSGFPTGVTLVLPADQASFNDVLDIFAQVDATVNSASVGAATAGGTLSVDIEGTGNEVVVYQFQNANSFTVPEPGAGAAGLAAAGILAVLARRR